MNHKVAAIVVWYNPDMETRINIESYAESVGHIYVVDNSDTDLPGELSEYLSSRSNINYVPLGENKGIAYALNIGALKAIEDGYEWLLTMDQDSQATPGMIERLYAFATQVSNKKPGIVAAQPDTPTRSFPKQEEFTIMDVVITSGNLVSSRAYQLAGGFVNKLFIDYVDFEFSLAVRAAGYTIVQINDAKLHHKMGEITPKSLGGIKMFPTNHSPLRHYYIARNRQYLRRKYQHIFPDYLVAERWNNIKMWIKIILYEKDKFLSLRMAMRGRRDFRRGIFGKYKP